VSETPTDFANNHEYSLHFNHQKDRSKKSSIGTRMFIVITMYNENRDELKRSLTGVAENLQYLCDKVYADFWKEVVVCIISSPPLFMEQFLKSLAHFFNTCFSLQWT
jgi:hypothetical protein